MDGQNKLTIKTKEQAKQLNELTNELVAASLFDSNLLNMSLHLYKRVCPSVGSSAGPKFDVCDSNHDQNTLPSHK